jgi:squalene synthase HpnC
MGLSSLKLRLAQLHCTRIALSHYENFFIFGPLTPLRYVPHLAALYAFSRHSDDLADEIEDQFEAAERLNEWQNDLTTALDGAAPHKILRALQHTTTRYNLPPELLFNLLSAFKQDLSTSRYETFEQVRDYTRRSADPVGRLVLRLYGYDDPELDELSDNVCTGLQLANFCQDMGDDARRGRIYIPLDECTQFDVDPVEILDCTPSTRLERLLYFQNVRAHKFLKNGLPLAEKLKGRLKISIRLFMLGGLQILENVRQNPLAALHSRITLNHGQKLRTLITSLTPLKDGGTVS